MIFDLYICNFGDGVYGMKTKVKGIIFKTIVEASSISDAVQKGTFNIRTKFKENGLVFERGMVQWKEIVYSFVYQETALKDPERCWFVDEEDGRIIPRKSPTPLMTIDECKKYILSRLFK